VVVLVVRLVICSIGGERLANVHVGELGGRYLWIIRIYSLAFVSTFQAVNITFPLSSNKTLFLQRLSYTPSFNPLLYPFSYAHRIVEMLRGANKVTISSFFFIKCKKYIDQKVIQAGKPASQIHLYKPSRWEQTPSKHKRKHSQKEQTFNYRETRNQLHKSKDITIA
jgi:hypothetical protein